MHNLMVNTFWIIFHSIFARKNSRNQQPIENLPNINKTDETEIENVQHVFETNFEEKQTEKTESVDLTENPNNEFNHDHITESQIHNSESDEIQKSESDEIQKSESDEIQKSESDEIQNSNSDDVQFKVDRISQSEIRSKPSNSRSIKSIVLAPFVFIARFIKFIFLSIWQIVSLLFRILFFPIIKLKQIFLTVAKTSKSTNYTDKPLLVPRLWRSRKVSNSQNNKNDEQITRESSAHDEQQISDINSETHSNIVEPPQTGEEPSTEQSQSAQESSTEESQNSQESSAEQSQNAEESSAEQSQNSQESSTEQSQNSQESSTEQSRNSQESSTEESQNSQESSTEESQTAQESSTEQSQTGEESSTEQSQTILSNSYQNHSTPIVTPQPKSQSKFVKCFLSPFVFVNNLIKYMCLSLGQLVSALLRLLLTPFALLGKILGSILRFVFLNASRIPRFRKHKNVRLPNESPLQSISENLNETIEFQENNNNHTLYTDSQKQGQSSFEETTETIAHSNKQETIEPNQPLHHEAEKQSSQEDQQSTEDEKQSAQANQQSTEDEKQSAQVNQQSTEDEKQSIKVEQQSTEAEKQSAQANQQNTEDEKQSIKADQQSTEAEKQSIKVEQQSTEAEKQSAQANQQNTEAEKQSITADQQSTEAEKQSVKTGQQETKNSYEFIHPSETSAEPKTEKNKHQSTETATSNSQPDFIKPATEQFDKQAHKQEEELQPETHDQEEASIQPPTKTPPPIPSPVQIISSEDELPSHNRYPKIKQRAENIDSKLDNYLSTLDANIAALQSDFDIDEALSSIKERVLNLAETIKVGIKLMISSHEPVIATPRIEIIGLMNEDKNLTTKSRFEKFINQMITTSIALPQNGDGRWEIDTPKGYLIYKFFDSRVHTVKSIVFDPVPNETCAIKDFVVDFMTVPKVRQTSHLFYGGNVLQKDSSTPQIFSFDPSVQCTHFFISILSNWGNETGTCHYGLNAITVI